MGKNLDHEEVQMGRAGICIVSRNHHVTRLVSDPDWLEERCTYKLEVPYTHTESKRDLLL